MGLLRYYLRVFFRSHFRPISPKVARRWELNASLIYFISAWSALGFAFYAFVKKKEAGDEIGSAEVFDVYKYIKKIGTKEEFTILNFTGTTMNKEVLSSAELDQKKSPDSSAE